MKNSKLSNHKKLNRIQYFSKIIIFGFFLVLNLIFSQIANATLYAPGATLEPDCPPTESLTTCGVSVSNIGTKDLTLSGARSLTLDGNPLTLIGTGGNFVFNDEGSMQFTPITFPTYSEGLLFYNSDDNALTYYNDVSGQHINIGEDTVVRVINNTSSTIVKGSVIYISGGTADTPEISLALANDFSTSSVLGLVKEDIADGEYGYVATGGIIHDIDTSSFTPGDVVYLSATTPGAFTATPPSHPNNLVPLGNVVKQDGSTGEIYVSVKTAIRRVFTPGSVVFANASTGDLNFDNNNFYWDDTSKRLGIGDNTPAASLTVGSGDLFEVFGASGNVTTQGDIVLSTGGGSITATGGGLTLSGAGASSLSTTTGTLTLSAAGSGTTSTVQIGAGGSGSTTPDFLALDVKSTTGDPAGGAEGDMYYNTFDNKFRCYENAGWKDCISVASVFSDPMTTIGDIIFRDGTNTTTRLAAGTNDQVLTMAGGVPTWANPAAGFADPMTTRGDIIYRDSSNTTNRLALGPSGQVLTSNGTDLVWASTSGAVSSVFGRIGVVTADPSDYTSLDDLTVNNSLTIPDYADFTSSTPPVQAEGRLFYDSTDKALEYYNSPTAPDIELGFETMFRAKNTTGSTIPLGSVVYVNGGDGSGVPTIALAKADNLTTSAAAGFTEEDISSGSYGTVHILGVVNNIDTSSVSAGDVLYLSATTAGAFTSTRPSQPYYTVTLGKALDNQVSGSVMSEISTSTQTGIFTAGSVSFGGSDGLLKQDNTNLFWDDSNKRLGIGDNTPAATLSVGSGDLFEVFGASGNVTTAGDITLGTGGGTIASAGGGLTVNSASATTLTLDSGTTGSILIGTGVAAKTITIGNATDDTFSLNSSGLNVSTAGALTGVTSIDTISTSATALTFAGAGTITGTTTLTLNSTDANAIILDSTTTGAVNIGTGASAKTITFGNVTGATSVNIKAGTGSILLSGQATGTSATFLRLPVKTDSGDPTTTQTNGAMYYNSNSNKFRCYENGAWINCIGSGSDLQYVTSYKSDDTYTNITSGTTTLTTVSISPSTATGDVVVRAGVTFTSSNNTDQSLTFSIKQTNCSGTVLESTNYAVSVNPGNTSHSYNLQLNYVAVDPGASSHTYAFCATTSTGDTDVTAWDMSALVIDTGADLAEIYTTNDDSIEAGDVVSLDPDLQTGIKKSSGASDQNVLGVVSTRPGMVIGGVEKEGIKAVPVALSGRVPVRVTTEGGSISEGDYLAPSPVEGVAMKSSGAGPVIGQAMSSYDGGGVGIVLMFVKNMNLNMGTILLGEVSPSVGADGTDNGLSTLIATIQAENARDPVAIIGQKITDGKQFLTDFISARVTAIRGYFNEVFAKKVHTEDICVKKSDGSEVCMNGDQLDALLNSNDVVSPRQTSTPDPAPEAAPDTTLDPVVLPVDATTIPDSNSVISPDSTATSNSGTNSDIASTPDLTPAPNSTTAPDSTVTPDSATDPSTVPDQGTASTPDPTPAPTADSIPIPDPSSTQ